MTVLESKHRWRGLTHSAAHYLLATADSIDRRGYARVADVARRLGLTRGSVSVAMQSLKAIDLVTQDENAFFHLTDRGRKAATRLRTRHEVVQRFLVEVLGLDEDRSHRESCRLEHLIDAPTARRLFGLLEYWHRHELEGALDDYVDGPCPVCDDGGPANCPCCGLECLEDPGSPVPAADHED